MRRLLSLWVIGVTVAASPVAAQTPKPSIPRMAIAERDTFRLGDPRSKVSAYAETPADSMVQLPPLTVDGADGVLFYLDVPDSRGNAGTIRRIAFIYNEKRDITALLEQQHRDFGPPSDYSSAPVPEGIRESWSWRDKETHLMFTRFTPAQNNTGAILVLTNLRP